jgi:hypothetical protein
MGFPGGGARRDKKAMADFEGAPAPAAAPSRALLAKDESVSPADRKPASAPEQQQTATPSRAWFPETFLFEPRVVTDSEGKAAVPVRVPDRLTTWRVLALAHSREGAQAGAVTSFRGTLPVYVDLVVPPFLMAGDEVSLPIQLVNTTEAAVEQPLQLEAEGGEARLDQPRVRVGAHSNQIVHAKLKVARPGQVALRAIYGSADAVVRTIQVLPAGRLVEQQQGGTLAAERKLQITGPASLDPASARAHLQVFPGALALLRSELDAAAGRVGPAEDAYSLLLSGTAAKLLRALGEEPNAEALRNLAIVSGQRVIRHGRAPDLATATLLAEAALAHPDNPVLSRLGERMSAQVAQGQRPDGTIGGDNGWILQRLLVASAEGVRAVKAWSEQSATARQRASQVAIRASGAFERQLERVQDGYTAAAILASGGISGKPAERLRAKVRDSIKELPDGSRELTVADGVVRADGSPVPPIEATALAVLALQGDPQAKWIGDLGSRLLGSYRPGSGWGDGRTNLVALRAVLALFRDPLPKSVRVVLEMDGEQQAVGELDSAKLRQVVSVEAPAPKAAGAHTWTVRAEPAVPGLGFAFSLQAWVPWEKEPKHDGLELQIETKAEGAVGDAIEVSLAALAPSGRPMRIRHALPAGAQADRSSLEKLVSDGVVRSFDTEDGAVTLEVAPLQAGRSFNASYKVVPTLAGKLQSGASSIELGYGAEAIMFVPPTAWAIR